MAGQLLHTDGYAYQWQDQEFPPGGPQHAQVWNPGAAMPQAAAEMAWFGQDEGVMSAEDQQLAAAFEPVGDMAGAVTEVVTTAPARVVVRGVSGLGAGILGALMGSAAARAWMLSPFWGGVAGFLVVGPLVGAIGDRVYTWVAPEV